MSSSFPSHKTIHIFFGRGHKFRIVNVFKYRPFALRKQKQCGNLRARLTHFTQESAVKVVQQYTYVYNL
jgi:hypothetical protein